ncbi:MAG: hypothetical protein JXR34_08690 [Bacteroidales bacterium]|nr:hypothetical protein [Bacteroidales bacterium]
MLNQKDYKCVNSRSFSLWRKIQFTPNLLIIFLLFTQYHSFSQGKTKALENNNLPSRIVIDFENEYASAAFTQASKAIFLTNIAFIGSSAAKTNISGLPKLRAHEIGTLEIESVSEVDFLSLMEAFKNTDFISKVVIKNSQISMVPTNFLLEHHVKEFYLENCRTIDPNSLNKLLTLENDLLKLSVINCGIYNVNTDYKSHNIKVLNLSHNKLASLTTFLPFFPKLDSLFIEGNNLPDPEYELEFCASRNLKYIRTDSVSPAIITTLKQINSRIFWDFAPITPEAKIRMNHYGNFNTNNQSYKVYSAAYMHYNQIFSNRLLSITFDTLFTEERFWDSLIVPSRLLNSSNAFFKLFRYRGVQRGHLTFNFYPRKNRKNRNYSSAKFFKAHQELTIYKDYEWVTYNPTKPKEFMPFLKVDYMDIRLLYHPQMKNFTIFLKEPSGKIKTIEAFPVRRRFGKAENISPKDLEKDYAKYLSLLARKNRKSDKEITKNKRLIRNAILQIERNGWQQLRSLMSPEERLLTEEKWMDYYVEILSHEAEALESCYPSETYWLRSLKILGYNRLSNINDTANIELKDIIFINETGSNIPVKEIFVIYHKGLSYRKYQFSPTIQAISLSLVKDEEISMIIILPDNSYGLVNQKEVSTANDKEKVITLKAQVTNYDLITIGQIINYLNL